MMCNFHRFFTFPAMASSQSSVGHSYTIGGVKVQFPCKAYPSQLSMMDKVSCHVTFALISYKYSTRTLEIWLYFPSEVKISKY